MTTIAATVLRRALTAAALTTLVVTGMAAVTPDPVSAATDTVVTSSDPVGDVGMSKRKRLTRAEKKSIDIRRVTVKRVDDRKARIVIKIRDVMRTQKFDQMFFVNLVEHPDTEGGPWTTNAGFTSKGRYGYSSYYSADYSEGDNCGLRSYANATTNEVVATIPWACTAEGPVRISVTAMTGTFRSDVPSYSRDGHSIRGYYTVLDVG